MKSTAFLTVLSSIVPVLDAHCTFLNVQSYTYTYLLCIRAYSSRIRQWRREEPPLAIRENA